MLRSGDIVRTTTLGLIGLVIRYDEEHDFGWFAFRSTPGERVIRRDDTTAICSLMFTYATTDDVVVMIRNIYAIIDEGTALQMLNDGRFLGGGYASDSR